MSLPRNFIENSTICPAGSWTYTSTLTFADGSSSSMTANVPCTANPDTTAPDVQITYPKKGRRIRSRRFAKTGDTAFDAAGIKSVQYAVARTGKSRSARSSRAAARRSAKCQFLKRSGRLGRRAKSCSRPRYLQAKGTTKWRGRVRRSLPRGPYIVFARATDNSGNTSRPRKLKFRIR